MQKLLLSVLLLSFGVAHAATPDPSQAKEKAPAKFNVELTTTEGSLTLECQREWAPHGVDRFYNLVKIGYFTDIAFFRVVDNFVAQFGIHGDTDVSKKWKDAKIPDDPVKLSNTEGTLTFAMAGEGTRTTQLFFNFKNNSRLDEMKFAPICKTSKGNETLTKLYREYGDGPPWGKGPDQSKIHSDGNAYLKKNFPKLDYVKSAKIL